MCLLLSIWVSVRKVYSMGNARRVYLQRCRKANHKEWFIDLHLRSNLLGLKQQGETMVFRPWKEKVVWSITTNGALTFGWRLQPAEGDIARRDLEESIY